MVARALALLIVAAAAGCPAPSRPGPCAPSQPARLELRDAAGALELSIKDAPAKGVSDLCDPSSKRRGAALSEPGSVTVLDRRGALVIRLRRDAGGDWSGEGPNGPRLRVHLDGSQRIVLGTDGVPLGTVTATPEGATVFDRARAPIATVKARGSDLVVADAAGATTHYLVPASSAPAAGALALSDLSLEERLALYFAFSR